MRADYKETLADYIRRVLKEKELSLRDVEEHSGHQITNSYISKIISGAVRNPTILKLQALAHGLDEPEEKVVRFALHARKAEDKSQNGSEEVQLQNLIRRFLTLPEKDRREFEVLWKMISSEIDRRKRKKE